MKAIRVLLVVIFAYLLILQIAAIWPFTIDDMYISLRYAKNWTNGYGLVWNVGQPPVEGYSNFSFVLLARIAMALYLNPVILLKGVGVAGLLFTCWAIYAITRLELCCELSLIPCMWLLLYKGQILWSVSGLETSVYEALVCWAVYFIFCGLEKSKPVPAFVIAALLLTLAGMTRPEAPALMLLFAFLLFWQSSKREWLLFCVTLLISFTPYFIWRWHYYGNLFPNPVYCKGFVKFLVFDLDKHYLFLVWPFALFSLLAIYKNRNSHYYFLWLPSVLYLILLMGADPIVAFDNRLFLPVFALLLPLAMVGVSVLVKHYLQCQNNTMLFFFSCLMALLFIPMMSLKSYRHFTENPLAGERLRETVIEWLAHNTSLHNRIVLGDSGLIPYKIPRQFIDSYCLNNRQMTTFPPSSMYQRMCDEVFLINPEAIILIALVKDGKAIYTPTDACLADKLRKSNRYCLQLSVGTGGIHSFYRYEIFSLC